MVTISIYTPMKKTFGLGSLSKIESIEVKWPNGTKRNSELGYK